MEQTVTLRSELNHEDEIMTTKEMKMKRREENMQVIFYSSCPIEKYLHIFLAKKV